MLNSSFRHYYQPGRAGLPVLLLLHGTGGNEQDLVPLGETLLPGATLLSPRGQVSESGMPRFFRRLQEGVFDLPDLHRRTGELADFVTVAAREYGFDAGQVVAVGFSNGANIAASLLLSHAQVLAGAVLFRAMTPFEPEMAPDLAGVPILLAAGQSDPLVPVANLENLAQLLKRAGAEVEVHWVPGGHNLSGEDVAAAKSFLARHFLLGDPGR